MEYVYQIRGSEVWSKWPMISGLKYPGPETHDSNGFYNYSPDVLRPELLAEMKRVGIEPDDVNVFYTSPGKFVPIHTDGFAITGPGDSRRKNIAAINWVTTKFPWKMSWYSSMSPDSEYEHKSEFHIQYNKSSDQLRHDYNYTRYIPEKMKVEYETSWDINPVLIRTNIPHNVTMLQEGTRWCTSVRFSTDNFDYLKSKIVANLHGGVE